MGYLIRSRPRGDTQTWLACEILTKAAQPHGAYSVHPASHSVHVFWGRAFVGHLFMARVPTLDCWNSKLTRSCDVSRCPFH